MIPDYERFFVPALHAVDGGQGGLEEVASFAADRLGLDAERRAEVIAYDGTPVHVARTREALRDLRRAGLVEEDDEGRYRVTETGRGVLEKESEALDRVALSAFPAYAAYRERYLARRGA